ncbi:MAG: M42 family metallopeptidase [Chloroflexi bacterium]|nr:M42 family metallopeptidase [Chloroflexota bacterium]
MKEILWQTLEQLTSRAGPPGFEQPVVAFLAEQFAEAGASVSIDPMGNLYAALGPQDAAPHLMISAHSDEIGSLVRHIDERGFLRFDPLGGLSPVLLVGRRVWVAGHPGVIGTKPGHLQTAEERRTAPPVEELYIDVGVDSAEEVAALNIHVGGPVTYDSPLQRFSNPDRASGKAIDNRLGCAVVLQLVRALSGVALQGRLTVVVAVQEEVGLRGATAAARQVDPDYALVVDTLPVGDTPEVAAGRMPGAIGQGPVIVLAAAGRTAGHVAHPRVAAWLEAAAIEGGIPFQRATSIGYAVTDAAAVHLRGRGIPTGVVGLPRRYSHSPVCTFDINDAVAAVEILVQFAGNMATHRDFSFLQ